MAISYRTHQVAVNAYLVCGDEFLLLKRTSEPLIWGPPGGRLCKEEDPTDGLKREVFEETGLEIIVHQPVTTWFGQFRKSLLLSIDYLCTTPEKKVRLSAEHSDFRWLSIHALRRDQHTYFQTGVGFSFKNFDLAWQAYRMNRTTMFSG